MKGQEGIWVSVGVTKNLGDYNSLRVEAGASVDGDPYDQEAWDKLWLEVQEQVDAQISQVND